MECLLPAPFLYLIGKMFLVKWHGALPFVILIEQLIFWIIRYSLQNLKNGCYYKLQLFGQLFVQHNNDVTWSTYCPKGMMELPMPACPFLYCIGKMVFDQMTWCLNFEILIEQHIFDFVWPVLSNLNHTLV